MQPPQRPPPEEVVDEASAESFPASDAPSWTAAHLGAPSGRPLPLAPTHEVRAALRADVERLMRVPPDPERRRAAREEVLAAALLEQCNAVVREPIDAAKRVHNLEADLPGAQRDAPQLVLGARFDAPDASGLALLLAVARALAPAHLRRTVRIVGFAEGGGEPYVERLGSSGARVQAMMALARVDLARRTRDAGLFFVGNLRSAALVRAARDAFRAESRIPVRTRTLPAWLPGVSASEHAVFWTHGWPAMMVTDAGPFARARPRDPDVDRMAAALPGLVAVVIRLAGGRI